MQVLYLKDILVLLTRDIELYLGLFHAFLALAGWGGCSIAPGGDFRGERFLP